MAARQYTAATGPSPCCRLWLKIAFQSTSCLLTDPLGLAEEALGPDQQNDDEYDEGADELELGGNEQRRHLDEQADDHGTHDGAPCGAETAEHRGRKDQQQELEPELVVESLRHSEEDTGEAGEHRADDPDHRDHPVDVDAGG